MTELLFLESGALVREQEESVQISCEATGTQINAEGVLAKEVKKLVSTGSITPRLSLLLQSRAEGLARILSGPREVVSAQSALRLGGFGTLFLELTGQCNERCVHCYADAGPEVSTSLSRETCEHALEDAVMLGFRRVQFTGGDPLLSQDLPALVEKAHSLPLKQEIYTNGLALNTELLCRLAPYAPAFAFSFYSANATTHDSITRVPGSQVRSQRAIVRVLEAGLEVRVGIILMEGNAGHYEETRALLESLGVQSIGWSGTTEVGRGELFRPPKSVTPSPGLHSGASSSKQKRKSSEGSKGAKNRALVGNLCLSSNGEVFPCIFNRATRLGSVYDRSLKNIADDPQVRRSLSIEANQRLSCYSCRVTDTALGGKIRR